jgi:hypothetical protein
MKTNKTLLLPSDYPKEKTLGQRLGLAKATTEGEEIYYVPPDKWEPLRRKLTLREAQFLNTYARTGDTADLNALVLGIIDERNKLRLAVNARNASTTLTP